MKKAVKFISLILILSMSFTFMACGSETESSAEDTKSDGSVPAVTVAIPSETATEENAETTLDASNVDLDKVIALTFDDGPATNGSSEKKCSTERILDVLEKYDAKATFFIQGINLTYAEFKERNTALLQREHDLGMEIGNHSFDHPYFNKISSEEINEQISKCNATIRETLGEDFEINIIRTPGGAEKQSVKDAIDMPIILWDIDTLDWDTQDADNTYNTIMEQVKGGSIVLMHDTYQATADAVEMAVPALIEKGYKLVTISELFSLYGKQLENHTTYYNAR